MFNNPAASKSSKVSWKRLGVVNAVFLLAAVAIGGNAAAAAVHGHKSVHRIACAQRASHLPCATVPGTQTAKAAARVSDGGELTPISPDAPVATPKAFAAPSAKPAPRAVSVEAPAVELSLDRSPVATRRADTRGSPADVLHGSAGSLVAMPVLSAPVAWSLLLIGLIGLFAVTRGPAAARAQSWAAAIPSRSDYRSGTRASALDRVDPARYAQAQVVRSCGGHFVRTAGRTFAA